MPSCVLCRQELKLKYVKQKAQKSYSLFNCVSCSLLQLYPVPSPTELDALYEDNYFEERTDRGYANYLSPQVENSILKTLKKNLNQLNFYNWERYLNTATIKTCLDVGCASGYFVNYMQNRGWQSEGIDIAPKMVVAAQKKNLNVREGDFLEAPYPTEHYDLITLWASLEHLPAPDAFIQKIYTLLKPGGHVYISTCHLGFWAKIRKQNWRFLNVPEHIWFFSQKSLNKYFENYSLRLNRAFTYGSGFTTQEKSSFVYSTIKKIADFTAKFFYSGDMIVCDFVKSNLIKRKEQHYSGR